MSLLAFVVNFIEIRTSGSQILNPYTDDKLVQSGILIGIHNKAPEKKSHCYTINTLYYWIFNKKKKKVPKIGKLTGHPMASSNTKKTSKTVPSNDETPVKKVTTGPLVTGCAHYKRKSKFVVSTRFKKFLFVKVTYRMMGQLLRIKGKFLRMISMS